MYSKKKGMLKEALAWNLQQRTKSIEGKCLTECHGGDATAHGRIDLFETSFLWRNRAFSISHHLWMTGPLVGGRIQ
jgi:hypothetical protein